MSAGACNTADNVACTCYVTVVYAVNNVGCLIFCITNDTAKSIITRYSNVGGKVFKHTTVSSVSYDTARSLVRTVRNTTINAEVLKISGLNSTEQRACLI